MEKKKHFINGGKVHIFMGKGLCCKSCTPPWPIIRGATLQDSKYHKRLSCLQAKATNTSSSISQHLLSSFQFNILSCEWCCISNNSMVFAVIATKCTKNHTLIITFVKVFSTLEDFGTTLSFFYTKGHMGFCKWIMYVQFNNDNNT